MTNPHSLRVGPEPGVVDHMVSLLHVVLPLAQSSSPSSKFELFREVGAYSCSVSGPASISKRIKADICVQRGEKICLTIECKKPGSLTFYTETAAACVSPSSYDAVAMINGGLHSTADKAWLRAD
jgi:hypothetical protein